MNDNRPKGNQKHMDLSARNKIEQGLNNGDSFRTIARAIDKDPSTISKEVRKHSYIADRKSKNFAPISCANNHDPNNPRASISSERVFSQVIYKTQYLQKDCIETE